MRKIIAFILILNLVIWWTPSIANAASVDCNPSWDGTWAVTEDCNFPDGYKISGDINLGSYEVIVKNGRTLWFDLSTNKITFTTGKITFLGSSSKMDNTIPTTSRYYETQAYSDGVGDTMTGCPAGTYAFHHISPTIPTTPGTHYIIDQTSNTSLNTAKTATEIHDGVAANGTMYCWAR